MRLLERPPVLPAWASLPESNQREVVCLLAQLLRDHVHQQQAKRGVDSVNISHKMEAADE